MIQYIKGGDNMASSMIHIAITNELNKILKLLINMT
jgi:hypothetical protein